MQLQVKMEYNIFPDVLQANLHFVKLLCITPNISLNELKLKKYGAYVINGVMFTNCQLSCLHKTRA